MAMPCGQSVPHCFTLGVERKRGDIYREAALHYYLSISSYSPTCINREGRDLGWDLEDVSLLLPQSACMTLGEALNPPTYPIHNSRIATPPCLLLSPVCLSSLGQA